MDKTQLKAGSAAHTLLTHLLSNPHLGHQLQILHNLALYDSGDALLGMEEKEALSNCFHLGNILERLRPKDKEILRSYL